MKYRKTISILSLCIAVLSLIATTCGIFTSQGSGEYKFTALHGQIITIYGKGIYADNSTTAVLQAIPQDIVTLVIAIPLLLLSLYLARKGYLKGKILLTGTIGYFLITYMMYTFIAMYNRMFLVYVLLMSTSFFAFVLSLLSFDPIKISSSFNKKLPIKYVGGYLVFSTVMIGYLWLARVVPSIINGTVPTEVEHGTTLTVQAFDLAFFLPAIFISGLLLLRRNPFGYLLAPVVTVSDTLIMIALLSKGISMNSAGVAGTMPMIIMMSLFGLLALLSVVLILKNVEEELRLR